MDEMLDRDRLNEMLVHALKASRAYMDATGASYYVRCRRANLPVPREAGWKGRFILVPTYGPGLHLVCDNDWFQSYADSAWPNTTGEPIRGHAKSFMEE